MSTAHGSELPVDEIHSTSTWKLFLLAISMKVRKVGALSILLFLELYLQYSSEQLRQ